MTRKCRHLARFMNGLLVESTGAICVFGVGGGVSEPSWRAFGLIALGLLVVLGGLIYCCHVAAAAHEDVMGSDCRGLEGRKTKAVTALLPITILPLLAMFAAVAQYDQGDGSTIACLILTGAVVTLATARRVSSVIL